MTTIENRPPTKVGEVSGGLAGDIEVHVHHATDGTWYVVLKGTDELDGQLVEIPAWALLDLASILVAASAFFTIPELAEDGEPR